MFLKIMTGTNLIKTGEQSWFYIITHTEAEGGIANELLSAVTLALIIFAILGYWFDQKW
jgi:hypothetical protein